MKRTLISITATTLLALPLLAAGQQTPIPPEAARRSPLTQTGEQDISRQMPEQEQKHIPTTLPREDATYNRVSRAQNELRELGYNPGPIDGMMGPRTRQALRQYQRDYNLPVIGTLNAATQQRLLGDERTSLPENWRETPSTTGRLMTEGEIQVAEQNRYAALPPYKIAGTAVASGPIMAPGFPCRGFSFAPYLQPSPAGVARLAGPLPV